MPRSCSNSSSSDDSTKPDTARLSHWTNSEICGDKTTQYICTNASILAHQMLKFELIKKFRHHAVRVERIREARQLRGACEIQRHHRGQINLPFASMEDIFRGMSGLGTYNLCKFNCHDWSKEFMDKVMKKHHDWYATKPMLERIQECHMVEILRTERRHVCVVTFDCPCHVNMTISYELTRHGKRQS
ncbi:hypothetical protein niasHS_006373 [Heterodera schachtii]|uniref:Uncharacterized protein n=1 Tax=Heterodera schachtii TaxID=97005 RepID=A0ABD2JWP7_HETSC